MYLEKTDEGYTPYANELPLPKVRKKPFRRRAKPQNDETNEPTTIMSTFQYNTRQNSQGGYTTSAVKAQVIGDTELLNFIATEAGTTLENAEAVMRGFVRQVTLCSAGCSYNNNFLGLLRFFPTSGGSSPTPDGFFTMRRTSMQMWRSR